jgi:hypothetical protein
LYSIAFFLLLELRSSHHCGRLQHRYTLLQRIATVGLGEEHERWTLSDAIRGNVADDGSDTRTQQEADDSAFDTSRCRGIVTVTVTVTVTRLGEGPASLRSFIQYSTNELN